ncbi:MAG: Ribonuclease HII [Chlamydiae bacterium]|nr:Ribonuclease HII [Chlamydiota bacterium]
MSHMLDEEQALWASGYKKLSGIDEAGRGPLAGPVVAACIYIPQGLYFDGVNDSKKLSHKLREELFEKLTNHPDVVYGVGIVDHKTIDEVNILQATFLAMREAYTQLATQTDMVLIDGVHLNLPVPSKKLIKGDARSYTIAAASIIAKVTRDQIMFEYDKQWPEYGFGQHKGYGTEKHRKKIFELGPCSIHRESFEPIKSLIVAKK